MGMDIGVVSVEILKRPSRAVQDFIRELPPELDYDDYEISRSDMESAFTSYVSSREINPESVSEIKRFIDGLPWGKHNDIALRFYG